MVAVGGVKGVRDAGQAGRVHQTRTLIDSQAAAGAPRSRKASGTPAEHLKSSYPANFAGGRSRPEASEGLKHAAERFRGLGRRQGRRPSLAGYQENFLASAEAVRDAGQV